MSISQSLQNALSGLTATARAAEVVSSNIANVNTDGYGVRRVALSSAEIGGAGAGVRVDGIIRHVNRGILADRRLAEADLSGQQLLADTMSRLELSTGGVGDEHQIGAYVVRLEEAFISAADDPSSQIRAENVVSRLSELANALNGASDEIQTLRQEADSNIATQIDDLNNSLSQVERLNADIHRATISGLDTSALQDQRQNVVDKIATIVPIREMTRPGGQIALMSTSGLQLVDGKAAQFEFTETNTIVAAMTLSSGGVFGVTKNGVALSTSDGFGALSGGTLQAAFELRDRHLVDAQSNLDATARDLAERLQDSSFDVTIGATDSGLLTDAGGRFDPTDTEGFASRISVNSLIDPSMGGNSFQLRNGLYSVASSAPGQSTQLNSWSDALSESRTLSTGGSSKSAAAHASGFTSNIGSLRIQFEDQAAFSAARWESLRGAELSEGVDTDFELQQLIMIEEAYAANAKVIQTIDTLMKTLLEIS